MATEFNRNPRAGILKNPQEDSAAYLSANARTTSWMPLSPMRANMDEKHGPPEMLRAGVKSENKSSPRIPNLQTRPTANSSNADEIAMKLVHANEDCMGRLLKGIAACDVTVAHKRRRRKRHTFRLA